MTRIHCLTRVRYWILAVSILAQLHLEELVTVSAFSAASSSSQPPRSDLTESHSSTSSSGEGSTSPWASSRWLLTLDLQMPFSDDNNNNNESSSGTSKASSRLLLKGIELQVTSDQRSKSKLNKDQRQEQFLGPAASFDWNVVDTSSASYINRQGEQPVRFKGAAWSLEFPKSSTSSPSAAPSSATAGQASILRGLLQVQEPAIDRNAIQIPPGSTFYLQAQAWREADFDVGIQKIQPLYRRYQKATKMLEEVLSHEKGDRRLDGTSLVDTLQAYGDVSQLVWQKESAQDAYQQGRTTLGYPHPTKIWPEGPWPGDDAWLTLRKDNPLYMSLPAAAEGNQDLWSSFFGNGKDSSTQDSTSSSNENIIPIGYWSLEPILEEGEYEWVDDED